MITLSPVGRHDLVVVLVGRVVVRRLGLELGRAGVDRLERRGARRRPAGRARTVGLVDAPQPGQLGVGEAEPLGPPPRPAVHAGEAELGEVGPLVDDLGDLVEEPRVDPGRARPRARSRCPAAARPRAGRAGRAWRWRPAPTSSSSGSASSAASARSQLSPARPCSSERSAFCSDSGNVRPMAMASPTDCIEVPSTPGGAGELLERPPGHLGDDVVDGRLEAGRRLPGDVVGDLVERVADGELGGDLGDREPGGLRGQRASCATPAGSSR